jgi:hypothetical protein
LVSAGTRIGDTLDCLRKATLSEKLKNGVNSVPALTGMILHDVFETALRHNRFDMTLLEQSLQQSIANKIEDIFAVNQTESDIATMTAPFLKNMHHWAQQFMGPNPMAREFFFPLLLLSFFLFPLFFLRLLLLSTLDDIAVCTFLVV